MFYCGTKVWFVPCGPQFPWSLSEINEIALYWLTHWSNDHLRSVKGPAKNIVKHKTYWSTHFLSGRLTPSDRLHNTLSTFQDGSPKLNKPSETLNKYWVQLRDEESRCAKLSYWHDFQKIVWGKILPPCTAALCSSLHLAPVSQPSFAHFLEVLPRERFIYIYLSYQNRWS